MNEFMYDVIRFLLEDKVRMGDAYSAPIAARFLLKLDSNKDAIVKAINIASGVTPASPAPTANDVLKSLATAIQQATK